MEAQLLNKTELSEYWPVSKNIKDEKINPYILRAQQADIKPFLGEQLYFDLIANISEAQYVTLLDGGSYELNSGAPIYFSGVKALLASFAYSRFVDATPMQVTRAGNKNKTSENSTEVDPNITEVKSTEAKAEGVRLQAELQRFLDHNQNTYPLYGKGNNLDTPVEVGIAYTKIPRSIQR